MNKIDPIIAVKDISKSALWFQMVFGCKRKHGGNEFAVLEDESGEILICLHKWGEHEHPTMVDSNVIPGNGLILYYKTHKLERIFQTIKEMIYPIEEDLHINPNSTKKEFSLLDIDGYYWTITDFHNYEG